MPVKNAPTTTAAGGVEHYVWDKMTAEPLKGTITRKLVSSDRMMIAHVLADKGLASFFTAKLPINLNLSLVAFQFQRLYFTLQEFFIAHSPVQTLPLE